MSNRLASNIRALYVLQGLSYIAPLAVLPYLTRVLGAEAFGRYAVAIAISQYFATYTDFGFNLTATREIARAANDRVEVSRIFWCTQAAKSLLALAALAVAAVAIMAGGQGLPVDRSLFLAATAAIPGSVLLPVWLFQGLQQMAVIVWSSVMARFGAMALTFMLIRGPEQTALAVLLAVGVPLATGIGCLLYIWRAQVLAWSPPTIASVGLALRDGWEVFLSTSAISLYVTSVIPVLRLLTDDATVGMYAAADRLVRAAHSFLGPVSQAFYPHINAVYAASPLDAMASLRRYIKAVVVLGGTMSIGLIAGAGLATELTFGAGYGASADILRWLAPLPLVIGLSNVFGVQTMLTMGYRKPFVAITSLAAVVFCVVVFPLTAARGANGTAMAVLLTETFVTVAMWSALRAKGVRLFLKDHR